MNSSWKLYLGFVLIYSVILTGCGVVSSLNFDAQDFVIESVPLPNNWNEVYRGADKQLDKDEVDSWNQRWEPANSDMFTRFAFGIDKYESIATAKKGYKRILQRFFEHGFKMKPLPEWAYTSDFANQYAMYCSWPETTGEFCYSVARYANFVVVVGLDPGDGVTLEQAPELFGLIDKHVQTVIQSASSE